MLTEIKGTEKVSEHPREGGVGKVLVEGDALFSRDISRYVRQDLRREKREHAGEVSGRLWAVE